MITVWSAAGSGKTTLLAHWARLLVADGCDLTWLSGEDLSRSSLPMRSAILPASADVDPGAEPARYVIVDDIHLIRSGGTKSAVKALIQSLPPGVRLIVAGRYQPFSSLTSVQAAGALVELRTADLAFSNSEVRALAERRGYELDDAVIDFLVRRTGGWATALALAVPWLKSTSDVHAAIVGFDGSHRAVADYLVSEVLGSLTVDERAALTRTAIRADVPHELAVVLAGRPDAGELLHTIAERNALLTEVSSGYHFHPVLLGFLQADTRRKDAEAYADSHAKAFRWFAARDDGAQAMDEALRSGQPATIQSALEQFGLELMLSGETDLVARATASLPAYVAPLAPLATSLLLEAPDFVDAKRADHLFDEALKYDHKGTPARNPWLAVLIALRCLESDADDSLPARLDRLRMDDIATLRRDSLALDLLAATAEAWCVGRLGDPADAQRTLREVGISADRAGYVWLRLLASEFAVRIATRSGEWDAAAAFEDQVSAQVLDSHTHSDLLRSTATIMSAARSYRRCEPVPLDQLDDIIAADPHGTAHGLLVPALALRSFPALDTDPNPRHTLETLDGLMRQHGPSIRACSLRWRSGWSACTSRSTAAPRRRNMPRRATPPSGTTRSSRKPYASPWPFPLGWGTRPRNNSPGLSTTGLAPGIPEPR